MGLAMLGAVSQGILWGVMVLGVFITYKLLDIADLTVDGSFALGGSVCAVLVVSGVDPVLAIFAAMLAGMIAGAVTGFLHTVFEIPAILAGILTQIALWSVNLRIMGKSNTPLLRVDTLFSSVTDATGLPQNVASIIVGLIFAILIIVALYWFFGTEIGSACRATGNNEAMVRALGVDTKVTKMIALTLSNGLVGLSGGLICESQGYADIGMAPAHRDRACCHRDRRGAWPSRARAAARLRQPSHSRCGGLGRVLPHPCHRAPAGYGRERHEAHLCRHRGTRALRAGGMGEIPAQARLQ